MRRTGRKAQQEMRNKMSGEARMFCAGYGAKTRLKLPRVEYSRVYKDIQVEGILGPARSTVSPVSQKQK